MLTTSYNQNPYYVFPVISAQFVSAFDVSATEPPRKGENERENEEEETFTYYPPVFV